MIAAALLVRRSVGPIRQQAEEELAEGRLRRAAAHGLAARRRSAAADRRGTGRRRRPRSADADQGLGGRAARAGGPAAAGGHRPGQRYPLELPERLSALPHRRHGAPGAGERRSCPGHLEADPGARRPRALPGDAQRGARAASPAEGTAMAAQTDRHDAADAEAPPGATPATASSRLAAEMSRRHPAPRHR